MMHSSKKFTGAYYTPDDVARTLVRWVVRNSEDRLLDPSCGDGRFVRHHENSVGIEFDAAAVTAAARHAPHTLFYVSDFFAWAEETKERFECAAGNPPFIRYQRFSGEVRAAARRRCRVLGVEFSQLASSWAPFLVVTASLLKRGGRMAFVVPAEIGHAPYAIPLLKYLTGHFADVRLLAIRKKVFAELNEDVWFLHAEGFGGSTDAVRFSQAERFDAMSEPPTGGRRISMDEWSRWNHRFRTFLLPDSTRELYCKLSNHAASFRMAEIARVGIGYVTGANDFFHLRPSEARSRAIDPRFLTPSVRNAGSLPPRVLNSRAVARWLERDDPVLLLRLTGKCDLPRAVLDYLDGPAGQDARSAYKCRTRKPWYAVPDVKCPDAFLSYMSGKQVSLVRNQAGCTCTNSVHAVRLRQNIPASKLMRAWDHHLRELSCEIEGHPLGGGMLKIEPREAARILLLDSAIEISARDRQRLQDGIALLRQWRHYD